MATRTATPLHRIEVHSELNDGTAVCLRTITPEDEPLLRAGIATLSAESRYLRFFSPTPMPPDPVVAGLVDVDGHDHIGRSEEHTSELQSLMRISYAVFCLKKKTKK